MQDGQLKQFRAIIERDEDGMFVASVPALPGCHTQGKTYEEATARLKEAIELYLEVMKEKRKLDTVLMEPAPKFFAIEDVAVRV